MNWILGPGRSKYGSDDVCTEVTMGMLESVIGTEFSRPRIDLHPDRITFRNQPRPQTLTPQKESSHDQD